VLPATLPAPQGHVAHAPALLLHGLMGRRCCCWPAGRGAAFVATSGGGQVVGVLGLGPAPDVAQLGRAFLLQRDQLQLAAAAAAGELVALEVFAVNPVFENR
jgi:hypothetical protein